MNMIFFLGKSSDYRAFLSATRLYNTALTSGLHEPTVKVSCKVMYHHQRWWLEVNRSKRLAIPLRMI